jgi:hypothetical protein
MPEEPALVSAETVLFAATAPEVGNADVSLD